MYRPTPTNSAVAVRMGFIQASQTNQRTGAGSADDGLVASDADVNSSGDGARDDDNLCRRVLLVDSLCELSQGRDCGYSAASTALCAAILGCVAKGCHLRDGCPLLQMSSGRNLLDCRSRARGREGEQGGKD